MNLDELRKYCNFLVNKDQRGNPATPEEFGVLVNIAINKFFNTNYLELLKLHNEKGTPVSELIVGNNKMKRYISESTIQLVSGTFPLPSGISFKHEISATCQLGNRPITKRRYVTLLSNIQWDRMITNELRDDFDEVVYGKYRPAFRDFILTSTWDYIVLSYIREITASVYDYCYDTYGNEYYMLPGYYLGRVGNVTNLYNGSTIVVGNVSHPTASVFPYYSTSAELDVDTEYHEDIAKLIVADMAVKDRELDVAQIEIQKP